MANVSVGVSGVGSSDILGVLVNVLGAFGVGGDGGDGARLLNRCRRSSRSLAMLSSRCRGGVVGVNVGEGELEGISGGRCLGEVGVRAVDGGL